MRNLIALVAVLIPLFSATTSFASTTSDEGWEKLHTSKFDLKFFLSALNFFPIPKDRLAKFFQGETPPVQVKYEDFLARLKNHEIQIGTDEITKILKAGYMAIRSFSHPTVLSSMETEMDKLLAENEYPSWKDKEAWRKQGWSEKVIALIEAAKRHPSLHPEIFKFLVNKNHLNPSDNLALLPLMLEDPKLSEMAQIETIAGALLLKAKSLEESFLATPRVLRNIWVTWILLETPSLKELRGKEATLLQAWINKSWIRERGKCRLPALVSAEIYKALKAFKEDLGGQEGLIRSLSVMIDGGGDFDWEKLLNDEHPVDHVLNLALRGLWVQALHAASMKDHIDSPFTWYYGGQHSFNEALSLSVYQSFQNKFERAEQRLKSLQEVAAKSE